MSRDHVIETSPGTWQVRIARHLLPHTWNSEAAARAGLDVERGRLRRRRERAAMDACREMIYGDGTDACLQRVIDIARFALGEDSETDKVSELRRAACKLGREGAAVKLAPYPHPGACPQCREARVCNYCGEALDAGRCTNGRCSTCHRRHCTPGEAHAFGKQGASHFEVRS